jgi:hypothetical protein
MEKEFVTYKQALALKQLGFEENCLASHGYFDLYLSDEDGHLPAPLKQQVFRWFREKYADVLVEDYGLIPHFTIISNMFLDSNKIWTYEEAENACIDKLLEIAKQHNNGIQKI